MIILLLILLVSDGILIYLFRDKPILVNNLFTLAFVLLGAFSGAVINHVYWLRKEQHTRNINIFDQKVQSFLNLCASLVEFNAYTDHLMRLSRQSHSPGYDATEIQKEYEGKRIESLRKVSQEINYSKLLYDSSDVQSKIQEYLELYEKIRKDEKKWSEEAFDELILKGRNIQEAIGKVLKAHIKKHQ